VVITHVHAELHSINETDKTDGPDSRRSQGEALMRRPLGAGGAVKGGGGVTGGDTGAGVTVNVTGTLTEEAPVALSEIVPL